ncbi:MAG: uracil phosphoribosyltransferase [Fimbriimonadaceae bacterium]|nr:uracil phosphoribosyltransferase [Fimbriimonadaceae bacterium]
MPVRVCDHPLAQHLLGRLRDKTTPPDQYRSYAHALSMILALDATRELPVARFTVETPLTRTLAGQLDQGLAVVPVLRAGLGMLDAFLNLFPDVAVGYIGLERDENTAQARRYYAKLPILDTRFVICLDPMLATGGSASQAIHLLKAHKAATIKMVCVLAAPEGVAKLQSEHPEVEIITASVDESLNDQKYIVPGLGDFGDRLYGTADTPAGLHID